MSPASRCFFAFAFAGMACTAISAVSSFAQGVESNKRSVPARLPVIDQKLLEQLPSGCTQSWAVLDQPLSKDDTVPLGQESRSDGPADESRNLWMPRVHSNPFARPASQSFPHAPEKTVPTQDADELLPPPRNSGEKPRPIAKLQAADNDNLLLPEEDLNDPLLSIGGNEGTDPLADMAPAQEPPQLAPAPAETSEGEHIASVATSHELDSQYPSAQAMPRSVTPSTMTSGV